MQRLSSSRTIIETNSVISSQMLRMPSKEGMDTVSMDNA